MSAKEPDPELTTSQINQSEAGPDIVHVDKSFFRKSEESSAGMLPDAGRNGTGDKGHRRSPPPPPNDGREYLYDENGTGDHERRPSSAATTTTTTTTNPAIQVLDRLISLTPSPRQPVNVVTPLKSEKTEGSTPARGHPPPSQQQQQQSSERDSAFKLESLEQSVLEIELSKLHDLLVKQEKVSQEKMSEYETHLSKLTGQTCLLHDQLKQAEEREKALAKKVNEQNQNQLQLSIVMQEYEKLISKLTAEIEMEKRHNNEQIEALTSEKDSALGHLTNVEAAFTDVHQKYEKCKKVIEDYKKNEAKMKSILADHVETLKIKEKQLETVQALATKQLESAHKEVDRLKQSHEIEMTRLRALLRKTELKVISLQESLEQKIKENQELTTICDDLIEGKVPGT